MNVSYYFYYYNYYNALSQPFLIVPHNPVSLQIRKLRLRATTSS